MNLDAKPLLYFLKTSEYMLNTYVIRDFLNDDDIGVLTAAIHPMEKVIPRNAKNIWIYQKLTETCREINDQIFKFQISGFDNDLNLASPQEDWIQTLANNSTIKLNVIICLSPVKFYINHGKYDFDAPKASLTLFPSYLSWKAEGEFLITHLSGDHFH
jgi:hypothetical protein